VAKAAPRKAAGRGSSILKTERNSAKEVMSKRYGIHHLKPIISHNTQGFTQTQQDEDDWNAQGKKSRKKREEKERVETVLRGSDARELYLQCYQLILWKQCHWLVTVKGFPKELEVVVRDLWGLRLGIIHKQREERSGYSSGTGTMIFSSTSEGDNTDTDGSGFKSMSSRRSKKSGNSVRGDEKLPKLIETLALCYLGMLLMRLPTSLGEISKWTTRDEIVYNRAVS
jgi:RNA polymerase I-specific transcription initiation factor RRN7